MLLATTLGVVGGLCTAWLLAVVNDGLHATGVINAKVIAMYTGLCAVTLSCNAIAGIVNSMIGQKVIAALRKDISARIVCAPIARSSDTVFIGCSQRSIAMSTRSAP